MTSALRGFTRILTTMGQYQNSGTLQCVCFLNVCLCVLGGMLSTRQSSCLMCRQKLADFALLNENKQSQKVRELDGPGYQSKFWADPSKCVHPNTRRSKGGCVDSLQCLRPHCGCHFNIITLVGPCTRPGLRRRRRGARPSAASPSAAPPCSPAGLPSSTSCE